MGSSGGAPSIGANQGFFPMFPQLGQEAFQPWDMSGLAAQAGMPSFPGGPSAQQMAPPVAAPPRQSIWQQQQRNVYNPASNTIRYGNGRYRYAAGGRGSDRA